MVVFCSAKFDILDIEALQFSLLLATTVKNIAMIKVASAVLNDINKK